MTNLKGGYILVNKNDANIYASVENALISGKPVLFYENSTTCYYIDTISKSGDDIVLTKGGKTITITDANVVTESGDIQTHLYEFIINCGDEYVSFLTSKNLGSYIIDDASSLTNEDKEYLKSLKDNLSMCATRSYDGFTTSYAKIMGFYRVNILHLSLNGNEVDFSLENPVDASDSAQIEFNTKQIF